MSYITKKEKVGTGAKIALDDMILTKSFPTTAGSKMLEDYLSLFDAEVVDRLSAYEVVGKTKVGEFGLSLTDGSAAALDEDGLKGVICLDVNGACRRTAALFDKVFVKPTYGTVSRFGMIPAACSGDTVGVMANSVEDCEELLFQMTGHDDKDGTSLPKEMIDSAKKAVPVKRIALIKEMLDGLSAEGRKRVDGAIAKAKAQGAEVVEVDGAIVRQAKYAWTVLMCAEVCNNVSRYDGVKYGYRAKNCKTIEDIYVKSRSEGFGLATKRAVLFGSEVLSSDCYEKTYDKALRVRRLIREYFDRLFCEYDGVILPACSKTSYTEEEQNGVGVYEESGYTAPASITGLPVVVAAGVQWLGKPLSDGSLLAFAKKLQ